MHSYSISGNLYSSADRMALIEEKLRAAFAPSHLEIQDDSHKHIGHEGAKQGAGHYTINITSSCFKGKSLIDKHRMIYQVLAELIPQNIHALKIQAYSD